jgi:TIR domain
MIGPMFFLSYARSSPMPSREANRHVIRFFDDLSENVSWLVSRATGEEPGFMDRSIHPGSRWTPELLHSLGTCQAFVALVAAPYLTSRWCGMEWYGFAQRPVVRLRAASSARQTAILPVIWAPYPNDLDPAVIAQVQRFSPDGLPTIDLAARYNQYGVLGLMQLRRGPSYRGVVWELAKAIADLHHSHWVEPRELRHEELRDVFAGDPAGPWKAAK